MTPIQFDVTESYASNENAINWNATLVYLYYRKMCE